MKKGISIAAEVDDIGYNLPVNKKKMNKKNQ